MVDGWWITPFGFYPQLCGYQHRSFTTILNHNKNTKISGVSHPQVNHSLVGLKGVILMLQKLHVWHHSKQNVPQSKLNCFHVLTHSPCGVFTKISLSLHFYSLFGDFDAKTSQVNTGLSFIYLSSPDVLHSDVSLLHTHSRSPRLFHLSFG